MTTLAVTNTLVSATAVTASAHNTNYSDIVTYINNRNSGSSSWDAISVLSASAVPLICDNSNGTSDIFNAKDNGSTVFAIADGGIWTSGSQSGCRVYRNTSAQTVLNNTETKVQFNGEDYDTQSEFDSATNFRFTATKSGRYLVTTTLSLSSITASSFTTVRIKVNGTIVSTYNSPNATTTSRSISGADCFSLSATDFVEAFLIQTSGASMNIDNGITVSFMTIAKIA